MKKFLVPVAIAALAATITFAVQRHAAQQAPIDVGGSGTLEGDALVSLMGGMRGIAAEVIWFRAERLQDTGRFVELAQLASLLTRMEPHTPEVWSQAAWNLAYNISVQMPDAADRWRWVEAGLKLLRDDGIRMNPNSPALHYELAWMFLAKIGGPIDSAHDFYTLRWRSIMREALAKHDYASVRMDPEIMKAVEREYGEIDWIDPESSALYWGFKALPNATDDDRYRLRRILYQSMLRIADRHPEKSRRALEELESYAREYPGKQMTELVEAYRQKVATEGR